MAIEKFVLESLRTLYEKPFLMAGYNGTNGVRILGVGLKVDFRVFGFWVFLFWNSVGSISGGLEVWNVDTESVSLW